MFALPYSSAVQSAKSGLTTPTGPRETRQAASVTLAAYGRTLEGYAAVFNEETRISGFHEVVLPGAFRESLRSGTDVLCLVDHDPGKLLARTRSGTLRLEEDGKGLHFEIDLPDTSIARDVLALVQRGDVGGCSFAFTVKRGGEAWQGKRRELRSVALHEISLVHAWPAYKNTSVQARAAVPPKVSALQRLLDTL